MRALCLTQPTQLSIINIPEPNAPAPGEVLLEILRVGVCGTDLHAFQGKQTFFTYPRILGHELAVQVLAVGAGVENVVPGDICAVEPFLNCGVCACCRAGRTNCCPQMRVLGVHIDGGMTHRIVVPHNKLHRSSLLAPELLAMVEPLCIGRHAFQRASLRTGQSVLVIGAGPIGLAVVEASRVAGFSPLMMELSPVRLEHARRKAGLRTIDAGGEVVEQLRGALDGQLPDCVFDCTGHPKSMEGSFNLVSHGGTVVFVGHQPGPITFHNPTFHAREITLHASRNATSADFQEVISALETGRMDVRYWLDVPVQPEEVADGFPRWLNPENGVIKPMIVWGNPAGAGLTSIA